MTFISKLIEKSVQFCTIKSSTNLTNSLWKGNDNINLSFVLKNSFQPLFLTKKILQARQFPGIWKLMEFSILRVVD